MGLSFHYKGKLRDPRLLKEMIEEVVDISKIQDWNYHVFAERFPNDAFTEEPREKNVYGICFSPPKCDVVCLTFLSNGRMCAFGNLEYSRIIKEELGEDYIYNLSVKTQFSGPQTHKLLIPLFGYLERKYFEDFELEDEGCYWETKDEALLDQMFEKHTKLLDSFEGSLKNIPMKEGETPEQYMLRLIQIVNKRDAGEK